MVTQKTMPDAAPRGVRGTLVTHTQLDKAAPWIRAMLGLALIAYTSYTTIAGVGADFAPLFMGAPPWAPIAAGLGVAVFLSLGEWLTSEHVPFVYILLLLIDARYTQRQVGPWVDALATYHLQAQPAFLTAGVSVLVSWGLAVAAARYGEILVFGKRKR